MRVLLAGVAGMAAVAAQECVDQGPWDCSTPQACASTYEGFGWTPPGGYTDQVHCELFDTDPSTCPKDINGDCYGATACEAVVMNGVPVGGTAYMAFAAFGQVYPGDEFDLLEDVCPVSCGTCGGDGGGGDGGGGDGGDDACTPSDDTCCNIADLGLDYCYQVAGTTADNCGSYYNFKNGRWKFCNWDNSVSKCRGKGGVKTTVEPDCASAVEAPPAPAPVEAPPSPPAAPVECMHGLAAGLWCGSVTDMDMCPKTYQQFEYSGETRYKGCAVVDGECKGKGEKFGISMPLTCEPQDPCDAALDTVQAATEKCSEDGDCDFTSFAALTDACDADQLRLVSTAFASLLGNREQLLDAGDDAYDYYGGGY